MAERKTKTAGKNYQIGLVGVGFVGGAVRKYFESKKYKIYLYDKYKKLGSPEEVNEADVVFVATPTPFLAKGGFDGSSVEAAIKLLKAPKIVVVKSSVVPGFTDSLQKKYPRHKILFNPEFLREVSAYEDFIHPDRQIIGVTARSTDAADIVMRLLPKAPYQAVMQAAEAEMVKYMANSFLALKVVFANEFFDICGSLNIDYRPVKEAVVKDGRIGNSHFDVFLDSYRGYGGSCFPKDVNAIIQLAASKKAKPDLLLAMRGINRGLLKSSGLTEEHFLKNRHKKKH